MAKIDDVAELLTEEITNFKKTIKKFEEISTTLDNTSIKTDIAHLKGIVQTTNEHQLIMATNNNVANKELVNSILTKLEYPKWIIQIGIFVTFIFVVVFAYSLYRINDVNTLEITAYEEGKSESLQHYTRFVHDKPEVNEIYNEWIKRNKE
jgi:hypothetical protein